MKIKKIILKVDKLKLRRIFFKIINKSGYQIISDSRLEKLLISEKILKYCDINKVLPAKGMERASQLKNIKILKLFDEFCHLNNLKYWIDFGTLLGAVRHKGFIPWDNDIDVSCFYDDIIPLLNKLKKFFAKNGYTIRERDAFEHFQLRILKINNKETLDIGLDIFFVKIYKGNKTFKTNEDYEHLNIEIKEASKEWRKFLERKDNLTINEIRTEIVKTENKLIDKGFYNNNDIFYYGLDYPFNFSDRIILKSDLLPLKHIKFEKMSMPCPNNYKKILKKEYGNYHEFPDKNGY